MPIFRYHINNGEDNGAGEPRNDFIRTLDVTADDRESADEAFENDAEGLKENEILGDVTQIIYDRRADW